METTKITERMILEAIKETFETGSSPIDPVEVVAFCERKLAALDNKSAKAKERAAAKKADGDALYEQVKSALTNELQTIAEIAGEVIEINADASVSRVQYRLNQLVADGVAVKEQVSVPGAEGGKARKLMAYKLAVVED